MEPPAGGLPGPMGNETTEAETYETPEDYIASLNADGQWVEYDAETNTATITSVEAFAQHVKNATKSVGAFDDLARGQAENYVFGDAANDALMLPWRNCWRKTRRNIAPMPIGIRLT